MPDTLLGSVFRRTARTQRGLQTVTAADVPTAAAAGASVVGDNAGAAATATVAAGAGENDAADIDP